MDELATSSYLVDTDRRDWRLMGEVDEQIVLWDGQPVLFCFIIQPHVFKSHCFRLSLSVHTHTHLLVAR